MRYITFLLYTVLMVLIAMLLGCSTENPLCSQNYCVDGEIFLRSQLFEDEEFSEVNIVESDFIAAFANTTPVQTNIGVSIKPIETDILTVTNSLKNNEDTFKGAFISVSAIVDNYVDDRSALHLRIRVGDPVWVIRMFVKDYHFDISSIYADDGTSYNMTLWVSDFENNKVFCRAVDPADIASGRSVLHGSVSPLNTTVSEVIDSMKKGESFFIFKKISITAPVVDFRHVASEHLGKDYEFIDLIENESDLFDNTESHDFRIYPNANLYEEFNQDYVIGTTYRFTLIVHYLSGIDFFDPKDIGVIAFLAD